MDCHERQDTAIKLTEEKIMNRKTLLSAALVTVISTGLVATAMAPAFAAAEQAKAAEKTSEQAAAEQDYIKVSEDALMAVRNVGGARLSIFDGSPDRAQVYADAAVTRVKAAIKDADKYALDIKMPKKDSEQYVPFNAGLSVSELLEPSKVKKENIAKANQHLHKGETRKAVEALKVGGIDVALTTELLPVQAAKVNIEDAARLIGDGKYYEANLDLKAVEDSVITEIYNTDSVPKVKGK
jgi:NhaP-type Na+/H+ or K+/H+ antiporter